MSTRALGDFAAAVGSSGDVTVVGSRHHATLGGSAAPSCREVRAPAGIVSYRPAEMTIRLGAGTTLAELDAALAPARQTTVLAGAPEQTVGGVLMAGRSGVRRLREGPLRDALLQADYVSADGAVITAGGPTVKNVTGYDLCRLLVGSLGTLGLVGEVILRTRPRPMASQWWTGPIGPAEALTRLYRPSAVLWDGERGWVLLEGHERDVQAQGAILADWGGRPCAGPPELPPVRSSAAPRELEAVVRDGLAGRCVVECGVGIVHGERPLPRKPVDPAIVALHRRLKDSFDPAGRLNRGRDPLAIYGAPR